MDCSGDSTNERHEDPGCARKETTGFDRNSPREGCRDEASDSEHIEHFASAEKVCVTLPRATAEISRPTQKYREHRMSECRERSWRSTILLQKSLGHWLASAALTREMVRAAVSKAPTLHR